MDNRNDDQLNKNMTDSKLLISYAMRFNKMKILKFTLSLLLYILKMDILTVTETFLKQSVFEKNKSIIIL